MRAIFKLGKYVGNAPREMGDKRIIFLEDISRNLAIINYVLNRIIDIH